MTDRSSPRTAREIARSQLTNEMWRILIAIDERRLFMNTAGRYEIEGEERPDRKSREKVFKRGLAAHLYVLRGDYPYRVTAKGKVALKAAGFGVRS
jgi:hypothetical protein